MVAPSRAAKTTAVVSIHEENNTEVEIPRIDPKDKPKLWISKLEIRHNTMMSKIRAMAQFKLLELVANDDDYFVGIDDIEIEIENENENVYDSFQEQKEQKPETKEYILLAKKAQILKNLLDAIMELPKEEIHSFLTTSSLPAELTVSSTKSSSPSPSQHSNQIQQQHQQQQQQQQTHPREHIDPETLENSAGDTSGIDTTLIMNASTSATSTHTIGDENEDNDRIEEEKQQEQHQQQDDDSHSYNWLVDCGDAWEDLPPVVQMNAMELGYTGALWDEDNQDLPVYHTLWKKLTPNQRTATIFLGNYDEQTWNKEVDIVLMNQSVTSLESMLEDFPSKDELIVDTPPSVLSSEKSTDKQSNDPIAVISQNDARNKNKDGSEESALQIIVGSPKDTTSIATTATEMSGDQDDNDDDLFSEFASNFLSDTNEEQHDEKDINEKEEVNMNNIAQEGEANSRHNNEEDDIMMDDFISNFVVSADEDVTDSGNENTPEKESLVNTGSAVPKNDDEEEAMMDDFISNFVVSADEDITDSGNENTLEKESLVNTSIAVPKNDDEEEATMDDFISKVVVSADEDVADSDNENSPEKENSIPNVSLVPKDENGIRDEEQPLICKPRESIMDRGFQGEESPLLPSKENIDPQKPDPSPSWSIYSYLYWIPVIIGVPIVFLAVNGSKPPKN